MTTNPKITQLRAVEIAERGQVCPLWSAVTSFAHAHSTGIWPHPGEEDAVIFVAYLRLEETDAAVRTETRAVIGVLDSILPEWRTAADVVYICAA